MLCYYDEVEISILFDPGFENTLDNEWLYRLATKALQTENLIDVEMGILITGQEQIRLLNKQYSDEDYPTDVLSFAMRDSIDDVTEFILPPSKLYQLGDVVISYPQAEIQATAHGHSVLCEVAILLIHGILHLAGYDHDVPISQHSMQMREQAIFNAVKDIIFENIRN